MMNYENLHELINRYESDMDRIYNAENDELFKWRAMYGWQQEWFKPEGSFANFADRYNAARKEFSLFIDNSRMHPSAGVVKLWEKEPETVERLFQNLLSADTNGDVDAVQNQMDAFLEGYEALRRKYYPGNWSFKQDRHSVSVYLAMNAPDVHYVFKSSEATTMAKYVDFGFHIGSGVNFSLENYYRLCDEIVAVLKQHESLLDKHFAHLTEGYYVDTSLHLLAFDLMYCCRTYGYYKGLTVPSTGKTIKKAAPTAEELAQKEAERLAKIQELEQEMEDLERSCDEYADISLIGVQVTSNQHGNGTVIAQEINRITVRFTDVEKVFILDEKYIIRPHFENDGEIISAFTKYGRAKEQIDRLQAQICSLQK